MTNISDAHVKVHFRMEIDEDGWPPASVESLWAVDLGDGTVRLDFRPVAAAGRLLLLATPVRPAAGT
ncbi:hypothetical protein ACIPLC_37650 [Kitasatospora sp. NPDC086801]|uniref:hypothetical protein n=1 Tax=Kitasatospora sp. NPDC086801 TaxID=3364066 RepID=UPI0038063856